MEAGYFAPETIDRFSSLLDFFPYGICLVDTKGMIRYCNPRYAAIVEQEPGDLLGTDVALAAKSVKRIPQILKDGTIETFHRQRYIVHGKERECILHRIPIKKGSEILGAAIVIVYNDLSDFYAFVRNFPDLRRELNVSIDSSIVIETKYTFEDIHGESDEIRKCKEKARKIAPSDETVLICGESGTGKELFAHSIHYLSRRRDQPFIKVNCAAIPDDLLLSELFGYEAGSFTGALKGGKKGKFELANTGTIFLDEIGELSQEVQAKLLNVLQEKEVDKIGARKAIPVDIRVISATNRNLEKMVEEKKFRLDLFYRLNVLSLDLPPLRERKGDIPVLARDFIRDQCLHFGILEKIPTNQFLSVLMNHGWRGNVRELNNVITKAIWNSETDYLEVKDLPPYILEQAADSAPAESLVKTPRKTYNLKAAADETEREVIMEVLGICKSRREAAEMLGLSMRQLFRKLAEYSLG